MTDDSLLSNAPLAQVNAILRERQETLAENLVSFARLLRLADLDITNGRVIDAARSLAVIDIASREDVRHALRACLVSSGEQLPLFDTLFDLYWARDPQRVDLISKPDTRDREQPASAHRQTGRLPVTATPAAEPETENPGRTYSAVDLLTTKDFSTYTSDDVRRARRLLRALAPKLATALGRRRRNSTARGAVDLRRSIRHSVRHGGEVVELFRSRRRIHKLRLVALCDISGSMDVYSRYLVQFLYALQNELRGVQTFVFSTRLNEVTHLLRTQSFGDALDRLANRVDSWSGGTSIGASLYAFDRLYARRRVSSRTVIMIISDGWDRGDSALLTRAMQSFRRRAFKVIWLNPLLGHAEYRPLAKGMAAALPYVDYFLPAHNLDSLARLGRTLVRLARD
ncbi:MAG TPA: VWA domain-containing protein [Dehalococcoidia bacterium]|nr:VWA domain-containing protein [Dehalococcoidia bacterium]